MHRFSIVLFRVLPLSQALHMFSHPISSAPRLLPHPGFATRVQTWHCHKSISLFVYYDRWSDPQPSSALVIWHTYLNFQRIKQREYIFFIICPLFFPDMLVTPESYWKSFILITALFVPNCFDLSIFTQHLQPCSLTHIFMVPTQGVKC